MKHFTTQSKAFAMKKYLPLKFEGVENFNEWLDGRSISSIEFPEGHTLSEAWLLWILLDNGKSIEFSSSCTMVNDWHEYGSINCKYVALNEHKLAITRYELSGGNISGSSEKLVFENEEVRTECGIVFQLRESNQLIVACGISPGSVSVLLPGDEVKFAPQFELKNCCTEAI